MALLPKLASSALIGLALSGCSVDDIDEHGKRCTSHCPSGLECIDGYCGGISAYCSAHPGHTFCADFESGELTSDFAIVEDAGTLVIDHTQGRGSKSALLTTIKPGANSEFAQATRSFPTTNGATVELDLLIHPVDVVHELQPMRLTIDPEPAGYDFMRASIVVYDSSGPTLELGYQVSGEPDATFDDRNFSMPLDTWTHLVFDWSFDSGTITISVDGEPRGNATPPTFSAQNAQLSIGAGLVNAPSNAWEIRHDNVLVDGR